MPSRNYGNPDLVCEKNCVLFLNCTKYEENIFRIWRGKTILYLMCYVIYEILRRVVITLSEKEMYEKGFPAYITSVGWMGYSDEKIVQV